MAPPLGSLCYWYIHVALTLHSYYAFPLYIPTICNNSIYCDFNLGYKFGYTVQWGQIRRFLTRYKATFGAHRFVGARNVILNTGLKFQGNSICLKSRPDCTNECGGINSVGVRVALLYNEAAICTILYSTGIVKTIRTVTWCNLQKPSAPTRKVFQKNHTPALPSAIHAHLYG